MDPNKLTPQLDKLLHEIQDGGGDESVGVRPSVPLLSKLIEDTYNEGKGIHLNFTL